MDNGPGEFKPPINWTGEEKDDFPIFPPGCTGSEAVRTASDLKPDLIVMDITMPEMDGYEATARIKEDPALKETPVIFLTGKSVEEDAGRAFAQGGLTFVCKPFSNQQIRDLVNLTLDSLGL